MDKLEALIREHIQQLCNVTVELDRTMSSAHRYYYNIRYAGKLNGKEISAICNKLTNFYKDAVDIDYRKHVYLLRLSINYHKAHFLLRSEKIKQLLQ